ncbi:MAG: helix-turn-helix domain-containing protein [Kiritimatiellia bacterium]
MSFDFSIVRDLRKRAGLTLSDVFEQSGISTSVLSKLERNQTTAELDTLFRLSRVFGLTTTDLIQLAESRTAQKASAQPYTSGDFHFQRIQYGNLKAFKATAPKGASISRPEIHSDNYEICWVLKGKMLIQLPKERHELNCGQSLQFDGALDHTYEALDDCDFLIIHLNKAHRF